MFDEFGRFAFGVSKETQMTSPRGMIRTGLLLAGALAVSGAALVPIAPALAAGAAPIPTLHNGPVVTESALDASDGLPQCIPPDCLYA
jgi:hypothetical protein